MPHQTQPAGAAPIMRPSNQLWTKPYRSFKPSRQRRRNADMFPRTVRFTLSKRPYFNPRYLPKRFAQRLTPAAARALFTDSQYVTNRTSIRRFRISFCHYRTSICHYRTSVPRTSSNALNQNTYQELKTKSKTRKTIQKLTCVTKFF